MKTVVVRYRPKSDRADENQELVEAAFAGLRAAEPDGLGYACFRLADGTFVHVASMEGDSNPLGSIPAFQAFTKEIVDRCEPGEGPNPQPATLVGNYRLLRSE